MSFTATISTDTLDGVNGFTIVGTAGQATGHSVASAGDVNGDGFDDLIIGSYYSYYSGEPRAGASYVVFGSGAPFAGEIDLSTLNGSNGFRLTQADAFAGTSVASAGDINGDGYADLIVGSGGTDHDGVHSPGDSYVVFGRADGFAADLDLASLNGTNGFRLDGLDAGFASSSASVSSAGDINGDGFDDLLVAVTGGEDYDFGGAAYIVFGSSAPFGANLELGLLDGSRGFQIHNLAGGASVAKAGDLNGDGIDDFLIGDSAANDYAGQVHVVFGRTGGFGAGIDLSTLDGSNGYTLNGAAADDEAGNVVASAGDVNGDGIDDLIVGARGANNLNGAAYVVFGRAGGGAADVDLDSLDGTNGFRIAGLGASTDLGSSVSSAGDVNGDGYDDVIVAAPGTVGTSGEAYVVFGGKDGFSASLDVGNLDGTNGFRIDGLSSGLDGGLSVAAAGDVNGDLLDDLIVGAEAAADGAGESYVIFGRISTSAVVRFGSAADQTIHGSDIVGAEDYLYGEGGDDIIVSYRGTDHADGGDGIDILFADYSAQGSVSFSTHVVTTPGGSATFYHLRALAGPGGDASSVEYSDFERFFIKGSATANNVLRGGSGGDYLVGGAGSDNIRTFGEPQLNSGSANSGDDVVDIGRGGATAATTGSDVVEMGSGGNDQLIVDWSAATVAVAFTAQFGSGGLDYASRSDFMAITIGGEARLSFSGVERFTLSTGSGNDVIRTGANADVVSSGAGHDLIDSGAGRDTIDGGAGIDRWAANFSTLSQGILLDLNQAGVRSLAGGTMVAGIEGLGLPDVAFTTGSGNDVLETLASGTVADVIATGSGNDVVKVYGAATGAATGVDSVALGAGGNDQLVIDYSAATEAVAFTAQFGSGGVDYASRSDFMPIAIGGSTVLHFSGVERFAVRTGSGADTILTGANVDLVSSGAGNDSINSGAGKATIDGGTGTDLWAADLSASGLAIAIDLNLAAIQNLADGSSLVRIEGFGLAGLVAGQGDDTIVTRSSGTVADRVSTGAGNDTVTVFGAATGAATGVDTIALGDSGSDQLVVDYSAATEAVTFTAQFGSGGFDYASRSDFMPITIGGVNVLTFSGIERFVVKSGSGDDVIQTGANADVLNGGAGADRMTGGAGNDTYYVDDAGDQAVEGSATGGTDIVRSSVSFALGDHVENLVLSGRAVRGTGNALANSIVGNAAGNVLNGGAGADRMTGGAGNDTYYVDDAGDQAVEGSATGGTDIVRSSVSFALGDHVENLVLSGRAVRGTGNALANSIVGNAAGNVLNGGAGADRMTGGAGNDTYYVDDAGDQAVEGSATGGTDIVRSSVSFALGDHVENLVLSGRAVRGTGNALANSIVGNAAGNVLNGGAGADRMTGGAGNDTYYVDDAGDQAVEGSATGGTDIVRSSVSFALGDHVENLVLSGRAVRGTGNALANSIVGNAAGNVLNGGAGADRMTGGAGADRFLFNTGLDGRENVDLLLDFLSPEDTIVLDRTIFDAIASNGVLHSSLFVEGTRALDLNDRIIFDSTTGRIFYDADGAGHSAAVLFAYVEAGSELTSSDFYVVT